MINVAYIEQRCHQLNLDNLPALAQLKLAQQKDDTDSLERIASNLVDFLNSFSPSELFDE